MSKYRPGAPVELVWEDSPQYWVVRGHVGEDVAIAWARECRAEKLALDGDLTDEEIGDPPGPAVDPGRGYVVRHQWARWEPCEERDAWGVRGITQELKVFRAPSSDRFPVTVAHDGDELHRIAELRAHRKTQTERAHAEVARRWPGATIEDVIVGTEQTRVRFRVSWCAYPVAWDLDTETVWVAQSDVDSWKKHANEGVPS